jgi:hypothetical protein
MRTVRPQCGATIGLMAEDFVPGVGDPLPPEVAEFADQAAYRVHIADAMRRAHELGRRYRRRGNRYALLSIVLAYAASPNRSSGMR